MSNLWLGWGGGLTHVKTFFTVYKSAQRDLKAVVQINLMQYERGVTNKAVQSSFSSYSADPEDSVKVEDDHFPQM